MVSGSVSAEKAEKESRAFECVESLSESTSSDQQNCPLECGDGLCGRDGLDAPPPYRAFLPDGSAGAPAERRAAADSLISHILLNTTNGLF